MGLYSLSKFAVMIEYGSTAFSLEHVQYVKFCAALLIHKMIFSVNSDQMYCKRLIIKSSTIIAKSIQNFILRVLYG